TARTYPKEYWNRVAFEMPGRLGHEGDAVPVFLGIGARGVKRVSGGRGEAAVEIDLAHLVGDRIELVAGGDGRQHRSRHAADLLVVAVRDRQEDAGVAVGGGAEQESVLAEADAPGVVAGGAEEFEFDAFPLTSGPSPARGEGRQLEAE